jgi:predicted membrane protein DUF2127
MAADEVDVRRRYRNPLGYALMAYKGLLGLGEVAVGLLVSMPFLDTVALFRRLSAEELREDPGDRLVGFLSRHLPSLMAHRGTVAAALLVLGVAKVAAAIGLYNGKEWGRYLPAALVVAGGCSRADRGIRPDPSSSAHPEQPDSRDLIQAGTTLGRLATAPATCSRKVR